MKKIFSIFIFFPLIFFSQDSLSLTKAVEIGLEKNYDIKLTLKNVEINTLFNNWGEAGGLPQINVNAGQNNTLSDQRKNPISQLQGTNFLFSSNEINLTPNLNWTIFNGFGIRANKNKLDRCLTFCVSLNIHSFIAYHNTYTL